MRNRFRYFNSSPEVIRLTAMMYIRYPLSLRQVEDILFERGIDICHETALSDKPDRACVGRWSEVFRLPADATRLGWQNDFV